MPGKFTELELIVSEKFSIISALERSNSANETRDGEIESIV